MCGIAAIFAYGEAAAPVNREEVLRMREQMASRGPDGAGEWFSEDRRVGLGHRRLSIIDLSPAGAQPMFNADRSLALIFNGEIYNYAELRSELAAKGYPFQSHCDAEVLLALYERHGADRMLDNVRGMYAFAIWDKKRQGLLLARDPFGIKPLYYSDNGNTLRLASQVKALRAGGKIDITPEPAGHVGFFLWGHVPDPYTLFKQIRSLPAGSTMWVDRSGVRTPKVFCSISAILAESEDGGRRSGVGGQMADGRRKIEDGREKSEIQETNSHLLRTALQETVRHHLVADVPVGVFLSAGLDSTTLAALAAEQGGNLRTVTLGFEEYKGTQSDETPLAEEFARRCGAAHQTIWVSRTDFEAERDHLFQSMDRPTTDGVNTFFVSLAARRAGLKVALSGVGGDELFATYPSFRDIPRTVRMLKWVSPFVPTLSREFRMVTAPILKRFTSPKYAGMFEYGGTYGGAYLLRRGMFMPWELPELLDPDLVREGWRELQTLMRLDETVDGIRNSRVKVSALELQWYMRHQLLRDSDWAGMGHSVEIRVPLVDVDFLRQIAPMLSGPNAPSKRDMAAAASKLITPEVLDRPKTGFQIPVREWLSDTVSQVADYNMPWADRGLRGWAKHIYSEFAGADMLKSSPRLLRSPIGFRASKSRKQAQRVLVYRIGQLGDTIVALPAMRAIRDHFPDAHIELLCDRHEKSNYILAADVLAPTGLFDGFITYDVGAARTVLPRSRFAALAPLLRRKRFDTIVYLAPSQRWRRQIVRDRLFFRMVGIKHFFGFRKFKALPQKRPGESLPVVSSECDFLMDRLAADGIDVPAKADRSIDLGLTVEDEKRFRDWLNTCAGDKGLRWIGVGPGCKQPVNQWPLENYAVLVKELVERFDVWPVIFGGSEDEAVAEILVKQVGRGYNAAGRLDVRATAAAMRHCAVFVGNDTGTMHIASTAGIPCVGIYSSRQWRGLWEPYTATKRILRSEIECEGCGLTECIERDRECLRRISPRLAVEACAEFLEPGSKADSVALSTSAASS